MKAKRMKKSIVIRTIPLKRRGSIKFLPSQKWTPQALKEDFSASHTHEEKFETMEETSSDALEVAAETYE